MGNLKALSSGEIQGSYFLPREMNRAPNERGVMGAHYANRGTWFNSKLLFFFFAGYSGRYTGRPGDSRINYSNGV